MKEKIIITTGGTGGHVLPAIALANELSQEYDLVFITDERAMKFFMGNEKFRIKQISCAPIKGSFIRKVINLVHIMLGMLQAFFIILSLRPKFIIGFGSYVSFPMMVISVFGKKIFKILGVDLKTIIHEQNSLMGKANAFLARNSDIVTSSFNETKHSPRKTYKVGFITRNNIQEFCGLPFPDLKQIKILVLGGSQGSSIFSKVIPKAISLIPQETRSVLHVTQQCREEDLQLCKEYYDDCGVNSHLSDFFTNVPELIANSHLVISRAGASTVAELAFIGRASILIPYPLADNHQLFNAQTLKQSIIIEQKDLNETILVEKLLTILANKNQLKEVAEKSKIEYSDAIKNFKTLLDK